MIYNATLVSSGQQSELAIHGHISTLFKILSPYTKPKLLTINLSSLEWQSGGFYDSVQSLSHVRLFVIPWTAARQAFLSFTISWSLLKLMSIESVMPANHLILYHPLLLPPSVFPRIRVFSNESVLHIMWPKYWESQLQHQSFQ